jgi:invasion protein IalB
MTPKTLTIAAALSFTVFATGGALAATPVGTYKDWQVLTADTADGKVCFAVSQPTDSKYSQPVKGRDPAFFQVTTVPAKSVRNEASTIAGYKFGTAQPVVATVDGKDFRMFLNASAPDTAWAVYENEAALVDAMRRGSKLVVTGSSSRGTTVTDTYSLSGITAALDAVAKACP